MSCLSHYEEQKKTSAGVESGTHVPESAEEDKVTQTRKSARMSQRCVWNPLSAHKYKQMLTSTSQQKQKVSWTDIFCSFMLTKFNLKLICHPSIGVYTH